MWYEGSKFLKIVKMPSIAKWLNTLWDSWIMELYLAMKRSEV